jgi:hypothetical protein
MVGRPQRLAYLRWLFRLFSRESSMSYRHRRETLVLGIALSALALWTPLPSFGDEASFGPDGPGNVFISPCGRPFRAKPEAPYPVADWFKTADTNSDGKIDHGEFLADCQSFFKLLDRNGDEVISPLEVTYYEQRIAPEVLGMRVEVNGAAAPARLLWRVQGMPGGYGGSMGPPTGSIDPGGDQAPPDESGRAKPYDASGAGASPYSFFDEPEPVTAADIHFRGLITKQDFLRLADVHFTTLDSRHVGYLTLDTLPETPVQKRLARGRHRGR